MLGKSNFAKLPIVLAASMLFVPNSALALDRITNYFLQQTLNDHGFAVGKPDGAIGPATRKGLKEFAAAYGAPSDPKGAFLFMVEQSGSNRKEIVDEKFLKVVEETMAQNLRDPSSVMIRNVYEITDVDKKIVCGEVNGKNAYGGYAGFRPFLGMRFGDKFAFLSMDGPETTISELTCLTAFPRISRLN